MALVLDTGVLYGSLDRDDANYARCRQLIEETARAREPLVVPAPVLVELDQLVSRRLDPSAFLAVIDDIGRGAYVLADLTPWDLGRVREICDRYTDANIGFVDAAVLAIVERLNEPKLATVDYRHFRMLRPRHVEALELLPAR